MQSSQIYLFTRAKELLSKFNKKCAKTFNKGQIFQKSRKRQSWEGRKIGFIFWQSKPRPRMQDFNLRLQTKQPVGFPADYSSNANPDFSQILLLRRGLTCVFHAYRVFSTTKRVPFCTEKREAFNMVRSVLLVANPQLHCFRTLASCTVKIPTWLFSGPLWNAHGQSS